MHKVATVNLGSDFPGEGAQVWRPARVLLLLGTAAAVAAVVWAALSDQPLDRLVAVAGAAVLTAGTAMAGRRRLVAGPRGVLVHGIGAPRILPWSQIRCVRSARSAHLGISSSTLEIDTVDDELLVFSRVDLGIDPADVLAVISTWWRPTPSD